VGVGVGFGRLHRKSGDQFLASGYGLQGRSRRRSPNAKREMPRPRPRLQKCRSCQVVHVLGGSFGFGAHCVCVLRAGAVCGGWLASLQRVLSFTFALTFQLCRRSPRLCTWRFSGRNEEYTTTNDSASNIVTRKFPYDSVEAGLFPYDYIKVLTMCSADKSSRVRSWVTTQGPSLSLPTIIFCISTSKSLFPSGDVKFSRTSIKETASPFQSYQAVCNGRS